MIKILLIIFLVILLILVFMPLRFSFILDDKGLNVELYLFGLFNIKIDIDNLVNKYLRNENKQISFKKILIYIRSLKYVKSTYKYLMKKTMVEEIKFEVFDNYENPSRFIFNSLLWSNIKYFLESNFKSIKDKDYIVYFNDNNSIKINLVLRTYLFLIIYTFFKDIKEIFKSIKFIKEVSKNESSN